jgi:hypothetical protein
VIKILPCVVYQSCVVCCGDHASQNSPLLHKRTKNHGGNCAVRPPTKTARHSVLEFFSGMLTLELDLGLNTNVGTY